MGKSDNKNVENDKYQGKKEYAFDVDRMIDEGLAGGTVNPEYDHPSVDEARPLDKEDRPKIDKDAKKKDKETYSFDVDRMVDEGLAGGTVDKNYDNPSVDDSRTLDKEEKPRES